MIEIKALRLRSITASNAYGVDIHFDSGLNVIHADNTSGKSTCLQAIVYALGLERVFGPRLDVPLPYAMRERIQREKDRPYEQVIQSFVMLQIADEQGQSISIRRDIEGGLDRKLVQTWVGGFDSRVDAAGAKRDFFLHDPGAASREDGFHAFLSDFAGWRLPQVPRYDGSECPLYVETLFPMFFVEQKRGWSTIQGPFPTFLGIQDLSRRALEFILDLDAGKTRRQRAELRKQKSLIEQRWSDRRQDLIGSSSNSVQIVGLPPLPTAEFAHEPGVQLTTFFQGEWMPVETLAKHVSRRAAELEEAESVSVAEAGEDLKARLNAAEERYSTVSAQVAMLRREYQLALSEVNALEKRIEALQIDLHRNQDAAKLQKLGSAVGVAASSHHCPTCHQDVSRELLPETVVRGMGISENIVFIKSQLDLYRAMHGETQALVNQLIVRYRGLEKEQEEVRREIRSVKNDLLRPSSSPIRSQIEELLRLQSRLENLDALREQIDGSLDELRSIAEHWVEISGEMKRLGSGDLTAADQEKVSALQATTQGLLATFGFKSFQPSEITLSSDNFRPQVFTRDDEGNVIEKDIGFEVSASDGIRLKWAYYLSLLALSQTAKTNHVGFVVFDEPGQQEMREVDLRSFLAWASQNVSADRQIIVATSEELSRVRASVTEGRANIQAFNGFILQPLD